jgi:hypothetical protein
MTTRERVEQSLRGPCRDVYSRTHEQPKRAACVGQVWERGDGSRFRVQGFSRWEEGWIRVREIGGDREKASYPPAPFLSGAFRLVH